METKLIYEIKLIPQVRDDIQLALERRGDLILVNGVEFDLSFLSDGDELPASAIEHDLLRTGIISRRGAVISCDILFPISSEQTDSAACFPQPILVMDDGPIQLPPPFPPALEHQEGQNEDHD